MKITQDDIKLIAGVINIVSCGQSKSKQLNLVELWKITDDLRKLEIRMRAELTKEKDGGGN